jgi:hypothetical protein
MRLEFLVNVDHAVASTVHGVANLDVVVVPSELLVGLRAGEESSATKEEADAGNWMLLADIRQLGLDWETHGDCQRRGQRRSDGRST